MSIPVLHLDSLKSFHVDFNDSCWFGLSTIECEVATWIRQRATQVVLALPTARYQEQEYCNLEQDNASAEVCSESITMIILYSLAACTGGGAPLATLLSRYEPEAPWSIESSLQD